MIMKRDFNVNCNEDISVFKDFMEKNKWGSDGCPFNIKYPFLSVPDMIKTELLKKFLGIGV